MTELFEKIEKEKTTELLKLHRKVFVKYLKYHDIFSKTLVKKYDKFLNKHVGKDNPKLVNYEYNKEMRMFVRDLKNLTY